MTGSIEKKDEHSIRCTYELQVEGQEKPAAIVHTEHTFICAKSRKKIAIPDIFNAAT